MEPADGVNADSYADSIHLRTAAKAYRTTPPIEGEPLAGAIGELSIPGGSNLSSHKPLRLSISEGDAPIGDPLANASTGQQGIWRQVSRHAEGLA